MATSPPRTWGWPVREFCLPPELEFLKPPWRRHHPCCSIYALESNWTALCITLHCLFQSSWLKELTNLQFWQHQALLTSWLKELTNLYVILAASTIASFMTQRTNKPAILAASSIFSFMTQRTVQTCNFGSITHCFIHDSKNCTNLQFWQDQAKRAARAHLYGCLNAVQNCNS